MVKVIRYKASSPPHAAGSVVFARLRQCIHEGDMVSWIHLTEHPNSHLDQFNRFAQLTADSPYTLQLGRDCRICSFWVNKLVTLSKNTCTGLWKLQCNLGLKTLLQLLGVNQLYKWCVNIAVCAWNLLDHLKMISTLFIIRVKLEVNE